MTEVSKYLRPSKYINRLFSYADAIYRRVYKTFVHDGARLVNEENSKFEQSSFDVENAQTLLNRILQEIRGRDFDFEDDSIHWLIFSALSLSDMKVQNILEIGTFEGQFTLILAKLFPDAKIVTVDLPASDPLLRNLYNREADSAFDNYKRTQGANLRNQNITLIESNSFFLLDKTSERFDLIWVDGGHLYPEVAWDLCNAYHLCHEGGSVLCDDVIPLDALYKDEYVSTESFEVLKYLQARAVVHLTLFLKRRSPELFARKKDRKYVAYLKKPYS